MAPETSGCRLRQLEIKLSCYWCTQHTQIKHNGNSANPNNTAEFKGNILGTYEGTILRKIFKHWKIYISHKIHKRVATHKASSFYHKKLLKKFFLALKTRTWTQTQIIETANNCSEKSAHSKWHKAEGLDGNLLLRKYFEDWLIHWKMKCAHNFYKLRLLKKYIVYWQNYSKRKKERRNMRNKMDEASKFYEHVQLRRCFKVWNNTTEIAAWKIKIRVSDMHYKKNMQTKYFRRWCVYRNRKLEKENTNKWIEKYNRQRLLKQYFQRFTQFLIDQNLEKVAVEKSESFYKLKTKKKVFYAWRKRHYDILNTKTKIEKIQIIFENRRKRIIFLNLKLNVFYNKRKRRKSFLASNMYNKRLTKHTLRKFQSYVVYKIQKRKQLCCMKQRIITVIDKMKVMYIEQWRKALYSVMQEQQDTNRALEFHQMNLLRTCFCSWKQFSMKYKLSISRKNNLFETASSFLLREFLFTWRLKSQKILSNDQNLTLAANTYNRKIMKECLSNWKTYSLKKKKGKRDIENAKELHAKFILREGLQNILRNSLRRLDSQNETQLKNATLQIIQDLELLKKFFDRWRLIIYTRHVIPFNLSHDHKLQFFDCKSKFKTNQDELSTNFGLVLPQYMRKSPLSGISLEKHTIKKF